MYTFSNFISEVNILRVLNLNAWGFQLVSSGYEEYRIRLKALQETLAGSDFDVVLLQEIWYQEDYEFLSSTFPHSASLTSEPSVFAWLTSKLPGNLTPVGRSGLTILSKFPIEETEFTPYTVIYNASNHPKSEPKGSFLITGAWSYFDIRCRIFGPKRPWKGTNSLA